jgi:hypothetical protein
MDGDQLHQVFRPAAGKPGDFTRMRYFMSNNGKQKQYLHYCDNSLKILIRAISKNKIEVYVPKKVFSTTSCNQL